MAVSLKVLIQVVFGVFVLASHVTPNPVPAKVVKQGDLVRLGSSMNVTFYAGHEEITWEEGKALCESHNLTLAEVHHAEQEEFLKNALTDLDEFSHYFTAGKTRTGLDALVWSNSNSAVDALSTVDLGWIEELCLFIRVPDYDELWDIHYCTDIWPPICQSI